MASQVLLNTAIEADALACGHPCAIEPDMGGLKITLEVDRHVGPILTLNGMDGEVRFEGEAELRELIRAANRALLASASAAARVMEAA